MPAIAGIYQMDHESMLGKHGFELTKAINIESSEEVIIWQQKQIFLGCTVSEDAESLPYIDKERNMAITAAVRLDKKDELFAGLRLMEDTTIQDGHLILLAYQKWGTDCLPLLAGEFIFIIWDGSKEILFGAISDNWKMPLYYYRNEEAFAFCTSIAPLLTLPYVENGFNENWFTTFTNDNESWGKHELDLSITPYEQIRQILPGQVVTVSKRQLLISQYGMRQPIRSSKGTRTGSYNAYI